MRHAVALCPAASISAGFFGVRRASEVTQLATNDVDLDLGKGVVNIRAVRQKNDQVGASRLVCQVAIPARGDARPVHIIAGWLRFGEWLKRNRGREGRMAPRGFGRSEIWFRDGRCRRCSSE